MTTREFPKGGYRFIEGVSQYSGGVAALPGHEIVRVRFRERPTLADGFARIAALLEEAARPLTAFCACELRSPEPFTEQGFRDFNARYVETLDRWGLLALGVNPVARSNVCPEVDKPAEPSFHAFSYTRPSTRPGGTFVVSGSGEVPEGHANYRDHIVCRGDTSSEAMTKKVAFVLDTMESRLSALGFAWADATAAQVYTVYDFRPEMPAMVRRGAAVGGATWFYARPPVVDIDFEMDTRGVRTEAIV